MALIRKKEKYSTWDTCLMSLPLCTRFRQAPTHQARSEACQWPKIMHKCSNKEARSEGEEEEETSCNYTAGAALCCTLSAPTAVQSATRPATPMVATAYLSSTFAHCLEATAAVSHTISPQHHVLFVQASKRYSDRVLGSLDDLRRLRRALAAGRRLHHEAPRCDLDGVYRESDVLGASDGGGAAAVARQRGEAQRRGESAGGGHGETDKEECVRAIGSPVPCWEKEKVGKGNTVTVAPVGFCDAVVVG